MKMPILKSDGRIVRGPLALTLLVFVALAAAGPVNAADPLRETPVVKAVRKASPAVVNVSSAQEVRSRANPFSGFGNPFFDEFFKDFFDPRFQRRREQTSLGSGVIIDGARGLILTNAHVVQRASTIKVTFQDEREFDAKLIGADPDSDLAVLKIESREPLPALAMGNSDDLMIGESVIAIGNPFGFSHTVTTGVISALNRSIRTDERVLQDFIQIDASINPGNSGGPLLNITGELIGINTAIYAKAQGIGFAIPIGKAKRIVADLVQYGEVKQAWIGILAQDLDERVAQYLNYPARKGAIVKALESESPAAVAGLREGDVLLSLAGRRIGGVDDYIAAAKAVSAGERVEVQVWRAGRTQTLSVSTREFPIEMSDQLAWDLIGIRVEDLTPKNRKEFRLDAKQGVVIREVQSGSQMARIGVRAGDMVRQIDDASIAGLDDFRRALARARQKTSFVLLVQRGDQGYYVTVSP